MSRLQIRHLGVTDEAGGVIGALRRATCCGCGRKRRSRSATRSIRPTGRACARRARGRSCRRSRPRSSRGPCRPRRRRRDLARARRADAPGRGARGASACGTRPRRAAVSLCVAVLGSAGRGESLLAMDQDNALVFAEGEPGGAEDRWFAALGVARRRYPATRSACPIAGRRDGEEPAMARLARHVARAHGGLDRAIQPGGSAVGRHLLRHARGARRCALAAAVAGSLRAARGQAAFAKLLAEAAGPSEPALGLFGGFRTEHGRIDLKRSGLFGIVTLRARSPSATMWSSGRRRRGCTASRRSGSAGRPISTRSSRRTGSSSI